MSEHNNQENCCADVQHTTQEKRRKPQQGVGITLWDMCSNSQGEREYSTPMEEVRAISITQLIRMHPLTVARHLPNRFAFLVRRAVAVCAGASLKRC